MGTNVASSSAKAVVVATGSETCFGSLAKLNVGNRAQTAFDHGVNSGSWLLIRFMLVVGLVPMPWSYFPWLVATLLGYRLVVQGMKTLYIRRFGQCF